MWQREVASKKVVDFEKTRKASSSGWSFSDDLLICHLLGPFAVVKASKNAGLR